jgi:hypothetical protein
VGPESASTIRRALGSSPIKFEGFTIRSNFASLRVESTLESTQNIPLHKQDFLIRGLKSPRPRKLIRSFKIPQVWTAPGNDNDASRLGEACIFLPRLGLPFPMGWQTFLLPIRLSTGYDLPKRSD